MHESLVKILSDMYKMENNCVRLSISLLEIIDKSDKLNSKLDRIRHLHEQYPDIPNGTLLDLLQKTKKILDDNDDDDK